MFPIQLRHLIFYKRVRSWPPVWISRDVQRTEHLKGEVGILKEVRTVETLPHSCFLVIQYEGAEYIGCLLLSDPAFCKEIAKLLQEHCGDSIEHIGSLDLSYTL